MAHDAFTTGRFLLDARLDPELSRRRYANWVRTSFGNSSHQVLVGELDGRPVGFFVLEREADDRVYWHLTAVAPDAQGRGVGLSLWRTMLLRHRAEGVGVVETTVSGHNPAVMNLYARLGFSFTAPQMTLHWLREPHDPVQQAVHDRQGARLHRRGPRERPSRGQRRVLQALLRLARGADRRPQGAAHPLLHGGPRDGGDPAAASGPATR